MSNDIDELRTTLFETLRGIKSGGIDIDKAKAINDTCQTLVNTAKIEIDYLRTVSANGKLTSPFFVKNKPTPQLPAGTEIVSSGKGVTVTRHKLEG